MLYPKRWQRFIIKLLPNLNDIYFLGASYYNPTFLLWDGSKNLAKHLFCQQTRNLNFRVQFMPWNTFPCSSMINNCNNYWISRSLCSIASNFRLKKKQSWKVEVFVFWGKTKKSILNPGMNESFQACVMNDITLPNWVCNVTCFWMYFQSIASL